MWESYLFCPLLSTWKYWNPGHRCLDLIACLGRRAAVVDDHISAVSQERALTLRGNALLCNFAFESIAGNETFELVIGRTDNHPNLIAVAGHSTFDEFDGIDRDDGGTT